MKKIVKKDTDRKDAEIRLRATPEFKRDAEKLADANGMDLSSMIRFMLARAIAKGKIT